MLKARSKCVLLCGHINKKSPVSFGTDCPLLSLLFCCIWTQDWIEVTHATFVLHPLTPKDWLQILLATQLRRIFSFRHRRMTTNRKLWIVSCPLICPGFFFKCGHITKPWPVHQCDCSFVFCSCKHLIRKCHPVLPRALISNYKQ